MQVLSVLPDYRLRLKYHTVKSNHLDTVLGEFPGTYLAFGP